MATKISLINMKGGVGKSTLAVNLTWHFSAYKKWAKRVLLVDLDPQFNASQYLLGVSDYQAIIKSKKPTIWDVFEQGTRTPRGQAKIESPDEVIRPYKCFYSGGKIDLIPSQLELAYSLRTPGHKDRKLSQFISKVEDAYDLIVIDCAPTESVLTTAAYRSSDWLLVPVKPEYLSTIGLALLVNSMEDFKAEFEDSNIQLAGVVFNATSDYFPEEHLAKKTVREVAERNNWHVFEHEVEYSRSYPKGAREGKPIFGTSYSHRAKVRNFNSFAHELAKRVKL